MSRQTERAEARPAAKVARASARADKRGRTKDSGYPPSKYRPVVASGKDYSFSSDRQSARYARQTNGAAMLSEAA